MEELFLHLWDEADDMYCACRHVATTVATETLASAAPLLAATAGALLAGGTALLASAAPLLPGT